MRVTYDPDVDAAYIYLVDRIPASAAVRQETANQSDVVLDFDADGRLLGVEVLNASAVLSDETMMIAERQPPT